ncbi:MAG: type II toxin-antitoxin system VapC family toxin [Chloroflexota bacterium]|jgi:PIN domain nuclease of toxin-antitoxin system
MIAAVADTHAVVWYLYDDERLSPAAGAFIDGAAQRGDAIGVSPITLVEIVYLAEKGRIQPQTFALVATALQSSDSVLVEVPLDLNIAQALQHVSRTEVPDMPDRIIAATALHFQVPVISRDEKIQAANLQTIW